LPGYEYDAWYGLWAPAGTPGAVVRKVNDEMNRALALPSLRERFAEVGIEPGGEHPRSSLLISRPKSKNGAGSRAARASKPIERFTFSRGKQSLIQALCQRLPGATAGW